MPTKTKTPIGYIAGRSGPRPVKELANFNALIDGHCFYFFVNDSTDGRVITERRTGLIAGQVGLGGQHMPGNRRLSLKERARESLLAQVERVGAARVRAVIESAPSLFVDGDK